MEKSGNVLVFGGDKYDQRDDAVRDIVVRQMKMIVFRGDKRTPEEQALLEKAEAAKHTKGRFRMELGVDEVELAIAAIEKNTAAELLIDPSLYDLDRWADQALPDMRAFVASQSAE